MSAAVAAAAAAAAKNADNKFRILPQILATSEAPGNSLQENERQTEVPGRRHSSPMAAPKRGKGSILRKVTEPHLISSVVL